MKQLNLLLMVNELVIGGAERQLIELARGIDKRRFKTTVLTLYPGGPLESELAASDGVTLTSLNRKGKYDLGAMARLVSFLRREQVDIIQPFLTPATFFGISAALLAGTPIKIVTERCGLRTSSGLGNRAYRSVEDRLARYAHAVVPNSEAGCDYVRERGIEAGKVRLIYNGINSRRLQTDQQEVAEVRAELRLPEGAPVVGIIASLEQAKDHQTFLDAAKLIADRTADTHFLIVGDGSLRRGLEARTRELGLEERVRFTGNRSDIAPLLASFSVALLSSRDNEGCSNFLLEAMGMSKPIVATDVGGNRELITEGRNGFLVGVGDASAMAERVCQLLSARELATAVGLAGGQHFESQFTLERMVTNYETLYEELWSQHLSRKGIETMEMAT